MDETLDALGKNFYPCDSPLRLLESLTKYGYIRIVHISLGRMAFSTSINVGEETFTFTDRSKRVAAEKAAELAYEFLKQQFQKKHDVMQHLPSSVC